MSRRTVAGLLALGLILVLGGYGALRSSGYVTLKPGPTINVLGELDGKRILEVSGHPTYRDDGALRMVTVYQSQPEQRITLAEMLEGWVDPDVALLPRDVVFGKDTTDKQVQQESAAQMTSSQDSATAAALNALHIPFTSEVAIPILKVPADSPSKGRLKPGDLLVSVGGRSGKTAQAFVDLIRSTKPGTALSLTVLRAGKRTPVTVTTEADPSKPTQSRLGVSIGSAELKGTFPFKVRIRLSDAIGGPSAGMMFALSLYDLLTPGSLTDGKIIAGSGTIDPDGKVGPIGGIGQKIVGAQRDGARLFLVAAENCAEAARAHYDHDKIRLVQVHTLSQAIDDLEAWSKDPQADLPGCRR